MKNIFIRIFLLGILYSSPVLLWSNSNLQGIKTLISTLDRLNTPSLSCPSQEPDPEIRKWKEAGYENPAISYLNDLYHPDDRTEYTHQFELDIVAVRNSDWTVENLRKNYQKVADVYAQCGVKLSSVRVIMVDSPNGLEEFSPGFTQEDPNASSSYTFGERVPNNNKRITSLHVRYLSIGDVGTSYSLERCQDHSPNNSHPLLYRQWVSDYVLDEKFKKQAIRDLSIEAHEMAHILLDFRSHYIDRQDNIMSEPFNKNGKPLRDDIFSIPQCRKIKQHELVTKISPE